ncbi:MAG: DnaA/Hda family protein [Pseudomonadota bacterium]
MTQQLSFDLPVKPALGREAFFVGPCNAATVAALETTVTWQSNKLLVIGPNASGKSHLVAVWCAEQRGRAIRPEALAELPLESLEPTARIAIDDADLGLEHDGYEEALFHLHNHLTNGGGRLLLAAQTAPSRWPLKLPDLASRLEATHISTLNDPDDQTLAAVLLKQFSDRQLTPSPKVLSHLLTHMDRAFDTAALLVKEIDRLALAHKKAPTLKIAQEALQALSRDGL